MLSSGFTLSDQCTGSPAKSSGQSALKTRTLSISLFSIRKNTKAYGAGSGGAQSETVPLIDVPRSESIPQPLQHWLDEDGPGSSDESKQHMVRSVALAGMR